MPALFLLPQNILLSSFSYFLFYLFGSDFAKLISLADYRYDLTDISSTLLDTFRECGICLNDLEMKLKEESVVYEAEANESFSD